MFAHFQMSVYDAQGRQTDVESRNVPVRCPMQQVNVQAAYQAFQNGAMLWRGDTRQIFVLYNDGTYQIYSDTWTPDQPVDTGETALNGLILPARGFGKVWAQQPAFRIMCTSVCRMAGYWLLVRPGLRSDVLPSSQTGLLI